MKMLNRYKHLLAEGMTAIPYWNKATAQGEIRTGTGSNGTEPNYMTDTEVFEDASEEEADECFILLMQLLTDLKKS